VLGITSGETECKNLLASTRPARFELATSRSGGGRSIH
jgi:hypothetical protein